MIFKFLSKSKKTFILHFEILQIYKTDTKILQIYKIKFYDFGILSNKTYMFIFLLCSYVVCIIVSLYSTY